MSANQSSKMSRCTWRCISNVGIVGLGLICGRTAGAQQGAVAAHVTSDAAHAAAEVLARRVTLVLRDVSLERAIDSVARSAKAYVQYQAADLGAYKTPVTVDVKDTPLGIVLEQLLARTKLWVVPGEKGYLTIAALPAGMADSTPGEATISGVVRDSAKGTALSGATVKIQGTKLSVVTSDSGRFTLSHVPAGDRVIAVRLFGYRGIERVVTLRNGDRAIVQYRLATVPTVLSGVVTTATGVQQRREVGNDITVLNVDSIRQVAPITSVTDLLESRVPGLTVMRSSGAPGDPSRLRLRGNRSINGSNDPIVIVDGIRVYATQSDPRAGNLAPSGVRVGGGGTSRTPVVTGNYAAPSPLDQIDPNSIESIEVFKGPSASSLYGADAANGVIVITTKKGRVGPTQWTMTANQDVSYLPGDYPVQILRWAHNSHDDGWSDLLGSAASPLCGIETPSCDVVDSVTHLQLLNLSNWSPYGLGSATGGSVGISGGASALTYALTASARSDIGNLKLPDALADGFQQFHGYAAPGWAKHPERYTTWGGNGQITAVPSPTATLTFASSLFHGLQQRSSLASQISVLASAPDTLFRGYAVNGHDLNAYERTKDEQLTSNNALSGSWRPWTWLPLNGTAGINVVDGHDVSLLARNIVPYGPGSSSADDTLGHYGVAQKNTITKTLSLNTSMQGWGRRLTSSVGFNMYSTSESDLVSETDTLPLGVTTPLTLQRPSTQTTTATATYGWFFEPRVMLSERFFLNPGFRLDGGNANGSNASAAGLPKKLSFAALFPKVNFSWIAVDRQDGNASPLLGVLTLFRPRLALGASGVQPTPGAKLRLLGPVGNFGIDSPGDSLSIYSLGNTQLRPERTTEFEGGFEADAWHDVAHVDLTVSRQTTHDAIVSVPVALSVNGGGNINLNIGEVRNTSVELALTLHPLETPLVSWSVGGNLAHQKNVVLSLDSRSLAFYLGTVGAPVGDDIAKTRIAVGYPLFGRWARPILGYGDANGDGIIEANEIRLGDTAVYLGSQTPANTGAFNTDLSLFHGRIGIHANISYTGAFSQLNAAGNDNGTFLSAANETDATFGQQAAYVAAVTGQAQHTVIGLAQTVSAWRFQDFSVNYNVPSSVARRFHANRMSVALQGHNLGLWTNYRGKDPNVNAYPSENATADGGQEPQPRTWSLQFTLGN